MSQLPPFAMAVGPRVRQSAFFVPQLLLGEVFHHL